MKLQIKRQDSRTSVPYLQTFSTSLHGRQTVSALLEELNARPVLTDDAGIPCSRVRWECSCMQKMCGGCAMVIDGVPALACSTFVDADREAPLRLEPLTKFPVIADLEVDRSVIAEHQKDAAMFLGTAKLPDGKETERRYEAAKCLKCGLCLEVCPNYTGADGGFYGALLANEAYLLYTASQDRGGEITQSYGEHFFRGCSKALSCRDICPVKMPTLSSIAFMNRKTARGS